MDNINDSSKIFKQSESEAAFEMRKLKTAKLILASVKKLGKRMRKLNEKYECNAAVSTAQRIIDGE